MNDDDKCEISILRLIVGHCPQQYGSWENKYLTTFSNFESEDNVSETLNSEKIHNGIHDPEKNIIFGITMDCIDKPHQIYRIDVGQSRAFDLTHEQKFFKLNIINNEDNKKKYVFSRTPQILHIVNDNLKIIRSKESNTRKHQPRDWYEKLHQDNKLHNFIEGGGYKYKYKYDKYLNKNK